MITENMMTIKSISENETFIRYQKKVFEKYNEIQREQVKIGRNCDDYDL